MTKLIDIRMICCLLLSMLYPLDGEGIKFYGVNSMNEMKYLFKNTSVIFLQKMNSMKDDSYGIGMTMHILPH